MNLSSLYLIASLFLFLFSITILPLGVLFLIEGEVIFLDWEILLIDSWSVNLTLMFDWLTLFFVGSVFFVSSSVVLYSYTYMINDYSSVRFFYLVILFVASMVMMVVSPNIIMILLGWDGLGLVSYCLVVYFMNTKSYSAGMITVLSNRIGDVAILLIIGWMFNIGSWHFVFYLSSFNSWILFIMMLVVLASFTKSAQMPFSSWLPAAMAAPTPVSALVHSSTLVTAGVYLLIRFQEMLMTYPIFCELFCLVSLMTMFMSGLGACLEFDLKKVIALSTLSQLGMMMSILFIGLPIVSFFHLIMHAFFKSLLFLCAGVIIHCMSDSQDMRHMGLVSKFLPVTSTCFGISSLALCGFPFLAGFYSKDLILESSLLGCFNLFFLFVFYLSVGLTVFYSFRLIYYCVTFNFNITPLSSCSEGYSLTLPLLSLTFMSLFGGSCFSWFIFDAQIVFMLGLYVKILPIILLLVGSLFGYEGGFNFWYNSWNGWFYKLMFFSSSMWYLPSFSTFFMSYYMKSLSLSEYRLFDWGWGEFLISRFMPNLLYSAGYFVNFYQENNLKSMMLFFLAVAVIFI